MIMKLLDNKWNLIEPHVTIPKQELLLRLLDLY